LHFVRPRDGGRSPDAWWVPGAARRSRLGGSAGVRAHRETQGREQASRRENARSVYQPRGHV
jgi:hypothetical protein